MHCLDVLDRKPFGKAIDPRGLQSHGRVERLLAFISEDDELRSPVVRIGLEGYETLLVQVVDNPLHVLTIGTHVAGEPRDRLSVIRSDHCAENLPTRTRQPEPRNQPIASGQDQAVDPKQVKNQVGQGIPGGGSLCFVNPSP